MRQKINLPQDFVGNLNILLIAFKKWHQELVDSWIPMAEQLEAEFPGVYYYELPTIHAMNSLARSFINAGMRAGIPNQKSRQRTITLYLDKSPFRQALDIAGEETITILLVDKGGEVLWRSEGAHETEEGEVLRRVIEGHHPTPQEHK